MKFRLNTPTSQRVWQKLSTATALDPRPRSLDFWGSGLPFCPRAFWLDRRTGPVAKLENAEGQCRMDQGTAIHAVVQRWLGKAGILFGDWVCPECSFLIKDHLGLPSEVCPDHKRELRYQERRIDYQGLILKPDGILKPKERSILLEIKTTSSYSYQGTKEPREKHVYQANAYACVLRELGFDLAGAWIWYVSVDNPLRDVKSFAFSPDEKKFKDCLKTMQMIRDKVADDRPLVMLCPKDRLDPWCIYHQICTNKKTLAELSCSTKQREPR